jgi:hypothetical protein
MLLDAAKKHYGNADVNAAIMVYRGKITFDQLPQPFCIYNKGPWDKIFYLDQLIDLIVENPKKVSIANFIFICDRCHWDSEIAKLEPAFKKRFEHATLDDFTDEDLMAIYENKYIYPYTKSGEFCSFSKEAILGRLFQNTVNHACNNLTVEQLEFLYDQLDTTRQMALKEAARKKFHKFENHIYEPLDLISSKKQIPSFILVCTAKTVLKTQTDCHICNNLQSVFNLLNKNGWIQLKLLSKDCLLQNKYLHAVVKSAYDKEYEEICKGNYVFYHGRRWDWDFVSDLYKFAYNLGQPKERRIGDDYVFLRFDQESSSRFNRSNPVVDPLFLNASIFGNAKNLGSCSFAYLFSNHDCSDKVIEKFSPEFVFSQFKLETSYLKYKKELEHLKELHKQANPEDNGNLLGVVIKPKDLDKVYLASGSAGKRSARQINGNQLYAMDQIMKEYSKFETILENSDQMEFVLPLDKEFALDPYKGPRIYRHNPVDPQKWQEYVNFRDQLFAKIAADIEKDKPAG